MKVVFDMDAEVLRHDTLGPIVEELEIKRSSAGAVLDVRCEKAGLTVELGAAFVATFGVKPTGNYDRAQFITAAAAQLNGSGSTAFYRFIFASATGDIDADLKVNVSETDDIVRTSYMGEFLFVEDTGFPEQRSQTFKFTIVNNVIRGGEDVPGFVPPDYMLDDTDPDNPENMLGDDNQPLVSG